MKKNKKKFKIAKFIKATAKAALKITSRSSVSAIILAGGNSERMGGISKQLIEICDIPVVVHSAMAFELCKDVSEIIVVCREMEKETIEELMHKYSITKFKSAVIGGNSRFESCKCGFEYIGKDNNIVSIHDAARCLITPSEISSVIKVAADKGAAIAATRVTDTLKSVNENGYIDKTVDRRCMWQAQTPQIFLRSMLEVGLYSEHKGDVLPTDDSMFVELLGFKVYPVETGRQNIKITTKDDIIIAEAILSQRRDKNE